MNRILRDITILVSFCGAFYLLTVFSGSDDRGTTNQIFTTDRIKADELWRQEKFQECRQYCEKLVAKDPHNGLAWHRIVVADWHDLDPIFKKEIPEKGTVPEEERKQVAKERRVQVLKHLELQKKMLDYPRYRSNALLNMAALYCFINERGRGVDCFHQAVDTGEVTPNIIKRRYLVQQLADDEVMQRYVESANRRRRLIGF